jgi:P2 family phage major capsid protein
MHKETRLAFNAYLKQIADLNGVPSATEKFTVSPTIEQVLEERIQLSSDFLQKINVIGVRDQQGAKLGMDAATTVAGRTDTTVSDRVASDISALDDNLYSCVQTNFDTAIKYARLDQWAKFPNFQAKLRDVILKRIALDRIMIGWNGKSVAATTDRVTNPLLQDVNKGWLQKYRERAAAQVMHEVAAASNKVRVVSGLAAAQGYDNLDALVFDAKNNLVHPTYRQDPELVVILGTALMADKYFPVINKPQRPEDLMIMDMWVSQQRVGGLPAVQVPFFPDNAMMITKLSNLSIYWQEGTRRRTVFDNVKRDQIENYESINEDYVVEDYRAGAVVENIELV